MLNWFETKSLEWSCLGYWSTWQNVSDSLSVEDVNYLKSSQVYLKNIVSKFGSDWSLTFHMRILNSQANQNGYTYLNIEELPYLNIPKGWQLQKKKKKKKKMILLKLQILWVCEIWGHFVKNWYFVNSCLIICRTLHFVFT